MCLYMDVKFIESMKAFLQDEKEALLKSINENKKEFANGIESSTPKDFADISSYASDQDMLDVLGAQTVRKLQAIDAALLRIEENRYGKCVKCGKDISEERLKSLPYAIKCVACQSGEERRR